MFASRKYIGDVREASRDLVRELGFMGRTIAGTDLSASGVHAIIEIGTTSDLSAKQIAEKLCLEKSTISRLIKSLVERKLVNETRSKRDHRIKVLNLTTRGDVVFKEVSHFGEEQVAGAIDPLDRASREAILAGLTSYSRALKFKRVEGEGFDLPAIDPGSCQLQVEEGYSPGIIGRVAMMHARYYSREMGFGAIFEAKVAGGMAEFVPRLDHVCNQIWRVEDEGRILGSITIDGEQLGNNRGQLRWFIVDGQLRGKGMGRRLIGKAVAFCDKQGFDETHLWTLKGQDAARKLYEEQGFKLVDEYYGEQWGPRVLERQYIRTKPR